MDETDIQQVIISPDKKVIRIRMNVARICISYQQKFQFPIYSTKFTNV
jgi:hypothetical protein